MTNKQSPTEQHAANYDKPTRLTVEQIQNIQNTEKQAEYEKAYLAQLRAQHCTGCGETAIF